MQWAVGSGQCVCICVCVCEGVWRFVYSWPTPRLCPSGRASHRRQTDSPKRTDSSLRLVGGQSSSVSQAVRRSPHVCVYVVVIDMFVCLCRL